MLNYNATVSHQLFKMSTLAFIFFAPPHTHTRDTAEVGAPFALDTYNQCISLSNIYTHMHAHTQFSTIYLYVSIKRLTGLINFCLLSVVEIPLTVP